MGKLKKAGSAGRFGARYGLKIRKGVNSIEEKTRSHHKCPRCSTPSVKRISLGLWRCKKCDYTFAGGCWSPQTEAGKTVIRTTKNIKAKAQ